MLRLLLAIVITIAVVLFVMVNMHQVALSLIFGPPVKIRLIFLLMLTFALGGLMATFLGMAGRLRLRRRLRVHGAQHEDESEDLFDE